MIQGSDEWFEARRGKVTASRIADVMAKTKTGPSAMRKNYMAQLVAERLTGATAQSFSNAAMQWGTDNEPDARAAYCFFHDAEVIETGSIDHPTIPMSSASPDGLVGDIGLVEIKCPNTATHINTLLTEKIDRKYMLQMQWQMACTGRQWDDFVSFDPRMPSHMSLWVKRVKRDNKMIAEIEAAVKEFLAEVDDTVSALRVKYESTEDAA